MAQLTRLRLAALLLVIMCSLPAAAAAQDQQTTDDLRALLRQAMSAQDIMAPMMAGMINATMSPDVSAAFYRINQGARDLLLSTSRIPLEKQFVLPGREWRPVARLTLGYLSGENQPQGTLVIDDRSGPLAVDVDWRGFSGFFEAGAVVPLGRGFRLEPFLGVGLAHLKNDATYGNDISREASTMLDGLLFNWDVTTMMAGAALGAAWKGALDPVTVELAGRVSYDYMDAIDATDSVQEFDDWVTTIDLRCTLAGPLGVQVWGNPLGWQVMQDYTNLPGSQSEGLGIDHYYETGIALTLDITSRDLLVQSLRLGGSLIYGQDVGGWSILFGYAF